MIVDTTLSIASDGKVSISVMPDGTGVLATGVDHVKVSSNDSAGYTLYIRDKDATTDLTSLTTADVIAAGSGTSSSPAALGTNTWGWRTAAIGPNLFVGVTTGDDPVRVSTTNAASNEITEVTYGVNVTTATDNGTYTDVVVYTAVNAT